MADSSYGNAMTEIALALAMAFFSIMVLTMVSMSATPETSAEQQGDATMKMAQNAPGKSAARPAAKPPKQKKQLVIYWNGRFLDRELAPVDPAGFAPKSRIILAMPPDLPMNKALEARARFKGQNAVVSALDARWLKRLQTFDSKGQ